MGLCKCERKRLTNLFCFEHRVNVCEFCMISSHKKCIVKSYLRWLQDSEFNPICSLCGKPLNTSSNEDDDECVRLLCLDIYHRSCLGAFICAAPPTTARSGYRCPICDEVIIPNQNHGGPVAEALRGFLDQIDWKSKSNSLETFNFPNSTSSVTSHLSLNSDQQATEPTDDRLLDPRIDLAARQFLSGQDISSLSGLNTSKPTAHHTRASVVRDVPPVENYLEIPILSSSQHKKPLEDDDKYRRRVAFGGLVRLFKSKFSFRCSPFHLRKRRTILLFVFLCGVLLIWFTSNWHHSTFSLPGHDDADNPNMDPSVHFDRGAVGAMHALKPSIEDDRLPIEP